MHRSALLDAPWREPLEVLRALADEPWAIGFLSGGEHVQWSYVAARPEAAVTISADDPRDPFEAMRALAGPRLPTIPDGPPFQGGVAGLACYELGDRIEPLGLARASGWPDLACARYSALLAFDHMARRVIAVGRGESQAQAAARAAMARDWLDLLAPAAGPMSTPLAGDDPALYEAAVAEVVARIAAGEIFQANIARVWRGDGLPPGSPADLLAALACASPAPFAAYLRLAGHALVSNSPERFLQVRAEGGRLVARSEPIKGTAPRGETPDADRRLAQGLLASEKDRAENLMIVDLMRNDLARVCTPGEVRTPELFRIATFANVHHLVSTVTGSLSPGRTAVDLLRAAFPPGSVTGAPKIQAMKVIAGLEPPRGPFFGSMFRLGVDGDFDSNVLIRTAAFSSGPEGWAVEVRAGAGIVADSQPRRERRETESKVSAIAGALAGGVDSLL